MLTQKQKDNRNYYAKHAEEIKEKKRKSYRKTKSLVKPEDQKKLETRRQIEDYKLAKELDIESF